MTHAVDATTQRDNIELRMGGVKLLNLIIRRWNNARGEIAGWVEKAKEATEKSKKNDGKSSAPKSDD